MPIHVNFQLPFDLDDEIPLPRTYLEMWAMIPHLVVTLLAISLITVLFRFLLWAIPKGYRVIAAACNRIYALCKVVVLAVYNNGRALAIMFLLYLWDMICVALLGLWAIFWGELRRAIYAPFVYYGNIIKAWFLGDLHQADDEPQVNANIPQVGNNNNRTGGPSGNNGGGRTVSFLGGTNGIPSAPPNHTNATTQTANRFSPTNTLNHGLSVAPTFLSGTSGIITPPKIESTTANKRDLGQAAPFAPTAHRDKRTRIAMTGIIDTSDGTCVINYKPKESLMYFLTVDPKQLRSDYIPADPTMKKRPAFDTVKLRDTDVVRALWCTQSLEEYGRDLDRTQDNKMKGWKIGLRNKVTNDIILNPQKMADEIYDVVFKNYMRGRKKDAFVNYWNVAQFFSTATVPFWDKKNKCYIELFLSERAIAMALQKTISLHQDIKQRIIPSIKHVEAEI